MAASAIAHHAPHDRGARQPTVARLQDNPLVQWFAFVLVALTDEDMQEIALVLQWHCHLHIRFATMRPPHMAPRPRMTCNPTLMIANPFSPSRSMFIVSLLNVENVVNPPS